MLNLTEENKKLCFQDSTQKPLMIFIYCWQEDKSYNDGGYWQQYKVIKDTLILESAQIEEGILESNNFELGSFVIPEMNIKWENDGVRYKNMACIPIQQIGDQYIAYFTGTVAEENVSTDGKIISAKLVPFIYNKINFDITDALTDYGDTIFADLISAVLSVSAKIYVDAEDLKQRFPNAKQLIPNISETELSGRITVGELIKLSGEFLGAQMRLKSKQIVDINNLDNISFSEIIEFVRINNVDLLDTLSSKNIPENYKILPYLEFDGNQYINTGVVPTNYTSAEYKFSVKENLDGNVLSHILSSYNCYFPHPFRDSKGANLKVLRGNTEERIDLPFVASDYFYNIKAFLNNTNDIVVNGETFETKILPNLSNETSQLCLGTWGGKPNYSGWKFIGKIYSCKIYENNVLIRNFVPCINENNVSGMYDLISKTFFTSPTTQPFITSLPVEYYTLPYHINLQHDKTNLVDYSQVVFKAKNGVHYFKNFKKTLDQENKYQIENNVFFEKISETDRWSTIGDVGSYLSQLNFYKCDLQTIYPLFIEPNDFLVVPSRNSKLLPNNYTLLEYIDIENTKAITDIKPNASNIEVNLDFEVYGNETGIFSSDGSFEDADTFDLYCFNNGLTADIGYYGGSANWVAFRISPILKQQKISLKINCNNGNIKYSGTYNGSGTVSMTSSINTNTNLSIGGRGKCRFYHFDYYENGEKKLDLYPCKKDENGYIGLFDLVSKQFYTFVSLWEEVEQPYLNHKSADIVIPVLSSSTNGIHSIRANIVSKATNMS